MPPTPSTSVFVDVTAQGAQVAILWHGQPPESARPLPTATTTAIERGLDRLDRAERGRATAPDAVAPALHEHGQALFDLLDGPERALATEVDRARRGGTPLHVVVRLRSDQRVHPCTRWRFELLRDADGALACRAGVTVVVQLGELDPRPAEVLEHCQLRILFMAYSPHGVAPVLDYEAEEEAILHALAPMVQQGRVAIEVVEDGTLAELERRLKTGRYDVVHLSGHGELRADGPCLLMEDEVGDLDRVGTERLCAALERGQQLPRLVVLASCETADGHDDLPSMAAGLVGRGVPAVVGWVRPVADADATQAAKHLYERLAAGVDLPEAAAFARRQLVEADRQRPRPTFAWATLHVVLRSGSGFALDVTGPPPRSDHPLPAETYRFLGDGRMRVLQQGFVGRRRELQRLVRILRDGSDVGAACAGVAIVGMKGVGKSCLAGRGIDRHVQDHGHVGLLVLHGRLDEATLLDRLRPLALEWADRDAERLLQTPELPDEPVERRVERLLHHPWRRRALVIVLDDFEQNLELRPDDLARVQPFAARLLAVLLRACRVATPKLVITTTAAFALPTDLDGALAEIALGPFEPAEVRKLWTRGQEQDLSDVSPVQWDQLADRLGRNARVLDWARALLGGRSHREVDDLVRRAQVELPDWRGRLPDAEERARLAALFLFHAAIDRAQQDADPDVHTFLGRARVYEVPVPVAALRPLCEGLTLDAERQLPVLANLGLLELGRFEGKRAYRVSPLVVPVVDARDAARWHRQAAVFFASAARYRAGWNAELVLRAWEHALEADAEDIADSMGNVLREMGLRLGRYRVNDSLAQRHASRFPRGFFGLWWSADAARYVGRVTEAIHRFRAAEAVAATLKIPTDELSGFLGAFGGALRTQGDLAGARTYFERVVDIESRQSDESLALASALHALGDVQESLGNLKRARQSTARSLAIKSRVLGTDSHPALAASYHALANRLFSEGDLVGARENIDRSIAIQGTLDLLDHPKFAASLHVRGCIRHAQGDLSGAQYDLERALTVDEMANGSDARLSTARTCTALGGLLRMRGDLRAARLNLVKSLEILANTLGNQDHPAVADSLAKLALVLEDEGERERAIQMLRRALEMKRSCYRTERHPSIADTEFVLGVMLAKSGREDDGRRLTHHALDTMAAMNPAGLLRLMTSLSDTRLSSGKLDTQLGTAPTPPRGRGPLG